MGELAYDKYLTEGQLDLAYAALSGPIWVRISHTGYTAAHIDAILLNGVAPAQVYNAAEETELALKKLATRDYDVIDAQGKSLVFSFNQTDVSKSSKVFPVILSLTARIEPKRITEIPFQFPLTNLFQTMSSGSAFYSYVWDSQPGHLTIDGDLTGEQLGQPFFVEFSKTGTGHPSDYTYGWVRNDADALYVAIDFVPDNTMDGDKDYAKVYVNTPAGLRQFKASVPEQRWGQPGFVYTPRVAYQHKVYEFTIPLSELGLTDLTLDDKIELAFAAYGTAAPDLSLSKSVTPTIARPGDTITYTLIFTDVNGDSVTGVVITDSIPISVTHSNLSYTYTEAQITVRGNISYAWDVEDLGGFGQPVGGIITITSILSDPLPPGTFTNTAKITMTPADSDPTNNESNAKISIPGAEVNGTYYLTLQDAIDAAVDGNTIKVVGGDLPDTPVTRAGLKQIGYITKSITIEGGYDGRFTAINVNNPSIFDVGGTGRGLVVSGTGVTVELVNLTLTGGNADAGGGFNNRGGGLAINLANVTLNNTDIGGNTATGGGGGVRVGSALVITNSSIISNNSAGGNGGGVYVDGVITSSLLITDGGQIISNTASGNGGGVYINGALAIMTQTMGTVISGNLAANGGGVYVNNGTALWSGGQVVSNTATTNGGGIYNNGQVITLLTNTTVSSNTASSYGGGIYNISGGSVNMIDTTVSSNTATTGGGGVYQTTSSSRITITTSSLVDDNAATYGGGFFVDNGSLIMVDSQVSHNTALTSGGGIYLNRSTVQVILTNTNVLTNQANGIENKTGGGGAFINNGKLSVYSSTFQANQANNGIPNETGGGGAYIDNGKLSVYSSTFRANQASRRGGGIFCLSGGRRY